MLQCYKDNLELQAPNLNFKNFKLKHIKPTYKKLDNYAQMWIDANNTFGHIFMAMWLD